MRVNGESGKEVLMILPSLRISGGVKEALRLANDLRQQGIAVRVLILWRNAHELPCGSAPVSYLSSFIAKRSTAGLQFPLLLVRFITFLRNHYSAGKRKQLALFLTHFSTFPFGWLAPNLDWYCFNQDVEWMFVKSGIGRACLRWFIIRTSRRSRVLTTNSYVEHLYVQEGVQPIGRLSIWAPDHWLTRGLTVSRKTDVVMLLRRGHMKRLDLYMEIVDLMERVRLTSVLITPDSELFEQVAALGCQAVLRPSDEDLKNIYRRSKIFLLLSDTEGFALPPLEAMGSGCVPLCRDSGGPRCYMTGPLASNIIPLEATSAQIFAILRLLLNDTENLASLSEYAREAFSSGSVVSLSERMQSVAALGEELRNGCRSALR